MFGIEAKFLVPILGILLLTQHILGNVIPEKRDDLESYSSVKNDTNKNLGSIQPNAPFEYAELYTQTHDDVICEQTLPKGHFEKFEKLSIFIYEQLTTFADGCLNKIKPFFSQVIAAIERETSLKEELHNFKEVAQEMSKVSNLNNPFVKFAALNDVIKLLDQYNLTKVKNPSKEMDLMSNILHQNDLDAVVKACDESGRKMEESFKNRAQEYIESLGAEERANDKVFDDWYTKFKNEKLIVKRNRMFKGFFELYCLDEDLKQRSNQPYV